MSQFEKNKKEVFSEQLKELMNNWKKTNKKKLTQEELAKAIYVTRETVSGWINQRTYPLEDTIQRLCNFFKVPEWYFTKGNYGNGQTVIDKQIHDNLEAECRKLSSRIGLSQAFVSFLKENQAIADAIISVSWIDDYIQSFSPSVPLLPDHVFQFVSSSGIKIYPSEEILFMLRIVQREIGDYALYQVQKWSGVITETYKKEMTIGQRSLGKYGWRTDTGEEFTPAAERFALELRGRGSLTQGASSLVNMYNSMTPDAQEQLLEYAHKAYHENRQNNPKAQKVRNEIKKAMVTSTPVPPLDTIMKDETASENNDSSSST